MLVVNGCLEIFNSENCQLITSNKTRVKELYNLRIQSQIHFKRHHLARVYKKYVQHCDQVLAVGSGVRPERKPQQIWLEYT